MKHKSKLTEKLTEDSHSCSCDAMTPVGGGQMCDHEPDQCPNPATVQDPDSDDYFCDKCTASWK